MIQYTFDEIKNLPSDTLLDEVVYYAEQHLNQKETEYWENITDEIFRRLAEYDEIQEKLKFINN